jgi:CHAT domain-containing protein
MRAFDFMNDDVRNAYLTLCKSDSFVSSIAEVIRKDYHSETVCMTAVNRRTQPAGFQCDCFDLRGLTGSARTEEPHALSIKRGSTLTQLQFLYERPPLWSLRRTQVMLVWYEAEHNVGLFAFIREEEGPQGLRCFKSQQPISLADVQRVLQSKPDLPLLMTTLNHLLAPALREVLAHVPPLVTEAMIILCPSLHSTPIHLLQISDEVSDQLLFRYEVAFCPSFMFLQILADKFNPECPDRSPDAPAIMIASSVEYEGTGPLHHLSREMECVKQAFESVSGSVEQVTAPHELDHLNMSPKVPAILSIHCHGKADPFSPDENKMIMQSAGASTRDKQLADLCASITPGFDAGYVPVLALFCDLQEALWSKSDSIIWSESSPVTADQVEVLLSQLQRIVVSIGGRHPLLLERSKKQARTTMTLLHKPVSFTSTLTKDDLRATRRYLINLWADREEAIRARITRCIRFEKSRLLHIVFEALFAPEDLFASDILRYVRLRGCKLVCLWACDSGLLDHNPTDLPLLRQSLHGRNAALADGVRYLGSGALTKHIVHHLPVAFIVAGCNAVISHLWKVYDASSLVLVDKFFELLLNGQSSVARCLQQAQRFVYMCTQAELRRIELRLASSWNGTYNGETKFQFKLPKECKGRKRPFEDLKFWGGYQLTGTSHVFDRFQLP